ncbi:MAG: hypothetical protein ACP5EN_11870 [Rhodovulum sp.]
MSKADGKQDYRVRADGWVDGRRVKKDDIVRLTPRGAKYENVDPVKPPARAAAKAKPEAGSK